MLGRSTGTELLHQDVHGHVDAQSLDLLALQVVNHAVGNPNLPARRSYPAELSYVPADEVDLGGRFAVGAKHVLELRTGLKSLSMEVVDPRFGVLGTFGALVGADQNHDHVVGEVPLVRTSPYQIFEVGFHRSLGVLDRHDSLLLPPAFPDGLKRRHHTHFLRECMCFMVQMHRRTTGKRRTSDLFKSAHELSDLPPLERVMNLGKNRIETRIPRSA